MEMEEVKVFNSTNEYEIEQVCNILEENDIPFIKRNEGAGEYLSLSMGQSVGEKTVYINKENYEKALELISVIKTSDEDIPEELKENEDEAVEEEKRINRAKLMRRSIALFIFGLPILAIILVIILDALN